MTFKLPAPRLLPVTIGVLGVVLMARSAGLVRSAFTSEPSSALFATAWAGGHGGAEKPKEKPKEKHEAKQSNGDPHAKPAKPPPEPAKAEAAPPPIPEGPPPMTESEAKVLLDLRARRQELEERETALAGRESVISAAEQKVSSRVDELKSLQQKLEGLDVNRRQQEESAWQGLVKVYEMMKPRDAAVIFNELAMPVLLPVIDRMKEAKAAAVLSLMTPDKARDVTTQLALSRTRAAAMVETGARPPAAKNPGSGT